VYGNAQVSGDAQVFDNARVSGNAQVYGNAHVFDNARVSGNAQVSGNALVAGNARVFGKMQCSKTPLVISGLARHTITVADNLVSVGCEVYTIEEWLENAETIGKANSYSEQEIKQYIMFFETIKKGYYV
jgi:acyl-[acyl carrier protein]--UDP-N-acetylglucosamine O-acyltransferase